MEQQKPKDYPYTLRGRYGSSGRVAVSPETQEKLLRLVQLAMQSSSTKSETISKNEDS